MIATVPDALEEGLLQQELMAAAPDTMDHPSLHFLPVADGGFHRGAVAHVRDEEGLGGGPDEGYDFLPQEGLGHFRQLEHLSGLVP